MRHQLAGAALFGVAVGIGLGIGANVSGLVLALYGLVLASAIGFALSRA